MVRNIVGIIFAYILFLSSPIVVSSL